jgi:carboxyl-terminal processing protease
VGATALALGLVGAEARVRAFAPTSGTPATEANITRLTASLLEHAQFGHHRLDDDRAGRFLEGYLDALDGTRSLFLQSDLDEFAAYRPTLAQATRGAGDTSAAQAIFARYLQRLAQRVTYVTDLLRTAPFDFSGHDVYSFDRAHAPRPTDLVAARALWRRQVRAEYLQEKLSDKPAEQIVGALAHRHAQQLRTMKELRTDEVLDIYLNALAHAYDPHSDYLGREEMESFSIAMNLSLVGIGAALEAGDGTCTIKELLPGGPAARSGLLKPGDRIVAVAQPGADAVDVMDMPLPRVVELIRGPKGSTVKLAVVPAGGAAGAVPRTISLVRDEINLEDQEARARVVDLPNGRGTTLRLGIVDLPSFYADLDGRKGAARRSATADVARLLNKLKAEGVQGVALDLRRNGGGSLDEAISLTGLFIRKGPVVQTRDPDGHVEVSADEDPTVLYDGPLIVLTSRFSASASEILVGALQDYGRAVVVGDPSTFGKGTVQNVLPLGRVMDQAGLAHAYDPGALKVTIRKFYRPSGASTQLRGVASDIVVPSTSDLSEVSESALKDPLAWDSVPPAAYQALNRAAPYVSALRDRSARRIATEKELRDVVDDAARLKRNLATKSVSLNEAERRHEMEQSNTRQTDRDRESLSLQAFRPTTYDITLQNVSSPGLPPPTVVAKPDAAARAPRAAGVGETDGALAPSKSFAATLNEAVRILADYVDLLGQHNAQTEPRGTGARAL